MKLCQKHWFELCGVIDERGLTPFISATGAEAARRFTVGEFDPLMNAWGAIADNVVRAVGIKILDMKICPICNGNRIAPDTNKWITYAADDVRQRAKELKLVKDN